MQDPLLSWGVVAAAIGSGLMAGAFFAFSSFVMRALAALPAEAVAAMQSINRMAVRPSFLALFLGTAVLCGWLLWAAGSHPDAAAARLLIAGSLLYLFGAFAVTAACNVPLNNALARIEPASDAAGELWPRYLRRWTRWNHLRTIASAAASLLFVLGLRWLARGCP